MFTGYQCILGAFFKKKLYVDYIVASNCQNVSKLICCTKELVIKTEYTTYIVCKDLSVVIDFAIPLYTVNHVNSTIAFIIVLYLRLLEMILRKKKLDKEIA